MTSDQLTEEQKRAYLEEACQALEKNPLKATKLMRESDGSRCCLCVMMDTMVSIAERDGIELILEGDSLEDYGYPPRMMGDFYGLPRAMHTTSINATQFDFPLGGARASVHNDGLDYISGPISEKTHAEIAAMIRKEYLDG